MEPLYLRFLGALVEELGRRMYPSATAAVAELISNAWDADAENVWIEIPFGEPWTEDSRITVTDDGNGMTRQDAADRYLLVGIKRRAEGNDLSERKRRRVHGRKGIGKLAAFGTADVVEVATKSLSAGPITAFTLDYDRIRKAPAGGEVPVSEIEVPPVLTRPDGTEVDHGTRVELSCLRLTQPISEDRFVRSMSRLFAIASPEMKVFINGRALERFAVKTRFRFPPDALPEKAHEQDGLAVEVVDGKEIRWWIGFTPEPIEDEELRGISVLARGKMAQRPFMFQRGGGVTSQLGQEYLVGEVFADWIDDDPEIAGDLISTNRAELMLEDARLGEFLKWGRDRLNWALRKRQQLVEEENVSKLELSQEVQQRLLEFTLRERRVFKGIGARLARLPEVGASEVEGLMVELMDGHSDQAVRGMIEEISAADPEQQDLIWPLVAEFGLIDARRLKSIIEARLAVIGKLRRLVEEGAREVPEIHQHLRDNYWLIDPRWQLMDDEVELTKLLEERFGINETDAQGMRLDFVYCLAPKSPAHRDMVFLVEIKRGTFPDGTARKVAPDDIEKFHRYYVTLDKHLRKVDTYPPTVQGIMVATDYTQQAADLKASFEKTGLEFRSWQSVLDETERLHLGWLALSRSRIEIGSGPANG